MCLTFNRSSSIERPMDQNFENEEDFYESDDNNNSDDYFDDIDFDMEAQQMSLPELLTMSWRSCPANGGLELFMIGTNFSSDCKVVFYEGDETNMTWRVYVYPIREFFHRCHLVCVVPPYLRTDITEPVQVRVVVECAGNKSTDPQPFAYTPVVGFLPNSPICRPYPHQTDFMDIYLIQVRCKSEDCQCGGSQFTLGTLLRGSTPYHPILLWTSKPGDIQSPPSTATIERLTIPPTPLFIDRTRFTLPMRLSTLLEAKDELVRKRRENALLRSSLVGASTSPERPTPGEGYQEIPKICHDKAVQTHFPPDRPRKSRSATSRHFSPDQPGKSRSATSRHFSPDQPRTSRAAMQPYFPPDQPSTSKAAIQSYFPPDQPSTSKAAMQPYFPPDQPSTSRAAIQPYFPPDQPSTSQAAKQPYLPPDQSSTSRAAMQPYFPPDQPSTSRAAMQPYFPPEQTLTSTSTVGMQPYFPPDQPRTKEAATQTYGLPDQPSTSRSAIQMHSAPEQPHTRRAMQMHSASDQPSTSRSAIQMHSAPDQRQTLRALPMHSAPEQPITLRALLMHSAPDQPSTSRSAIQMHSAPDQRHTRRAMRMHSDPDQPSTSRSAIQMQSTSNQPQTRRPVHRIHSASDLSSTRKSSIQIHSSPEQSATSDEDNEFMEHEPRKVKRLIGSRKNILKQKSPISLRVPKVSENTVEPPTTHQEAVRSLDDFVNLAAERHLSGSQSHSSSSSSSSILTPYTSPEKAGKFVSPERKRKLPSPPANVSKTVQGPMEFAVQFADMLFPFDDSDSDTNPLVTPIKQVKQSINKYLTDKFDYFYYPGDEAYRISTPTNQPWSSSPSISSSSSFVHSAATSPVETETSPRSSSDNPHLTPVKDTSCQETKTPSQSTSPDFISRPMSSMDLSSKQKATPTTPSTQESLLSSFHSNSSLQNVREGLDSSNMEGSGETEAFSIVSALEIAEGGAAGFHNQPTASNLEKSTSHNNQTTSMDTEVGNEDLASIPEPASTFSLLSYQKEPSAGEGDQSMQPGTASNTLTEGSSSSSSSIHHPCLYSRSPLPEITGLDEKYFDELMPMEEDRETTSAEIARTAVSEPIDFSSLPSSSSMHYNVASFPRGSHSGVDMPAQITPGPMSSSPHTPVPFINPSQNEPDNRPEETEHLQTNNPRSSSNMP
ncbi:mucin-17 isoform X2 [Nilaparvata lugens]|uniref:mucin-17 isoform X2 n=1 Tax=Nilaparvata lugens TaxID=108931 RepID=UPI00193D8BF0|nr:mucin-17 isoform X2 [Nilaparvata lugens]